MSLDTTLAAADARAAAAAERAHIKICAACRDAKERRRPLLRCDDGADLAAARARAQRQHAEEKRLDAMPHPKQGRLF